MNQVQTQTQTGSNQAEQLAKLEQHKEVLGQLFELYTDLFSHDGYGDIGVEIKILRRGQKEVILHCGKQYRYVLDCDSALANESPIKALLKRDLLS
ncbi:hypothetical protein [Neptuniibacter sp. QD34_54]|uniref:hypothetical protein n=1 Tax=Neptuniibacter sp. QD34_54 TaxID=3398208 RepID=UPI0039F5AF11